MCFGNLRGIREAGRIFALPTYLFSGSVILMVVVGIVREVFGGGLPQPPGNRTSTIGHNTGTLIAFADHLHAAERSPTAGPP